MHLTAEVLFVSPGVDGKLTKYIIACKLPTASDKGSQEWKVPQRPLCCHSRSGWMFQVEHRFSEFIDLHTLFVKKKKLTIPRMPPKRFFDHGPDVINERIDGLSQVLKIMVQQARYDPDLQLFLKPEGRDFPASLDEQMDTKGFQF